MKKRLIKLAIIIVVIALLAGIGKLVWQSVSNRKTTPPQKKISKVTSKKERGEKQEALIEIIKEIFAQDSPGTTFSLAVCDLKNKEYFGTNDVDPQHAASVSKVLTAVYVLDQVEKGNASLSDGMGAYNSEFQLEKMINISNSVSWEFIDERFKPEDQNPYAKSIGLEATDLRYGENKMSPKDTATLLKKLANGELLKESHRTKLFSYMQKTETENFFSPAFDQADLTYYHKTGKFEGEAHDAEIVKHKKYPFILVVFSNNNIAFAPNERAPVMVKTATEVLDYFDNL